MYPDLLLKKHKNFYWSPAEKTVFYDPDDTSKEGVWALLHESAHAILRHQTYRSDFELLRMEVEAWERAKQLANELLEDLGSQSLDLGGAVTDSKIQDPRSKIPNLKLLTISEDHIQDCLDTYRNWLHKRSLCPNCTSAASRQTNTRTPASSATLNGTSPPNASADLTG